MTTTRVQTRGQEAAVGMTWEDLKTLTREEFFPNNEMQKLETEFWCHVMVGAGHAVYIDRFHKLARLVPHLVTPVNKRIKRYIYGLALQIRAMVVATKPTTIQSGVLKLEMLTDEAIRNGALKKVTKKRGNNGEPSKDCKVGPRVVNPLNARNMTAARRAYYECGGTDHYKTACPRLNRAPRPGGNHPNEVMVVEGGQGRGNNGNKYMEGLFFVSTTFISLLDIEPSNLGFSYEIKIASGQLVEINKVIRGMDWLSRHKAEIVFHEKVVRIPLPNGKILRVLGEKPEEKVRHSKSAKVKEQKLKDIVVVRNFSKDTLHEAVTVVIVSYMGDAKLAHRVSMLSPTDSICSGDSGTAIGGGDGGGTAVGGGEGDLDLLRDEDGKSDGDGEVNDIKSDGGDDNDGISDGSSG
ncbi:putative reverse transcriptase domain-containing protein [Tanacetum coccineum]